MKIGSEAHKEVFCTSFMESHLKYEPENLPWPKLDDATLARLREIPFWEEAFDTERNAGVLVSAFAATVSDPLVKEAIALQGVEEARHSRVIEFLINHYGVETPIAPAKDIPKNIESAFTNFGYGECFDSFFAFGLFEIARQSGLFPEQFFTIFDPILDEEARHMVFFVNWIAYQQVQQGRRVKPLQAGYSLWHYIAAIRRRLDSFIGSKVSGNKSKDGSFTATGAGAVSIDLSLEKFLLTCLQENERRMSAYDRRLLRPQFMPSIASAGLRALKLLPKSKSRDREETTELVSS